MGARMSYDLSDGLGALRSRFANFKDCGGAHLLADHEISEMVGSLQAMRDLALALEHELSRHRWNAEAQNDRLRNAARLGSALAQPNSNVRLFPVVARPLPKGARNEH